MRRDIIARVTALEARRDNTYVPPPPVPLALYIVGYFGGKYSATASPFENYYHALGCERAGEFYKLSAEQVTERHEKVLTRILKRRGIDRAILEPWDNVERMLRKLVKAAIAPPDSWGVAA
jgi:hypothetical protein